MHSRVLEELVQLGRACMIWPVGDVDEVDEMSVPIGLEKNGVQRCHVAVGYNLGEEPQQ